MEKCLKFDKSYVVLGGNIEIKTENCRFLPVYRHGIIGIYF